LLFVAGKKTPLPFTQNLLEIAWFPRSLDKKSLKYAYSVYYCI
jgi:hypothetical protein